MAENHVLAMIGETYTLQNSPDFHLFTFLSEGEKGTIQKVVIYSYIKDKLYNLGFGDLIDDGISDSIISNNADLVKVMNTVAKTVYLFFEKYPDRQIYIAPVDRKRSVLYHAILSRRFEEIKLNFIVSGLNKYQEWENFREAENYLAFKLERKH